jgi:hypothetical protein
MFGGMATVLYFWRRVSSSVASWVVADVGVEWSKPMTSSSTDWHDSKSHEEVSASRAVIISMLRSLNIFMALAACIIS